LVNGMPPQEARLQRRYGYIFQSPALYPWRTIERNVMLPLEVTAHAADKITLQLKWVTQAQFAGYFVAKDKGYYKEADLDVTINPGGPDIAPEQVIAGGGADVIIDWMPAALAAREKGVGLVNISQPFKK